MKIGPRSKVNPPSASLIRLASGLLIILMMASSLASFYLERLFLTSRPAAPSPDAGYVQAFEVKGRIVFVSYGEALLMEWSLPISLIFGMGAALLWGAADRRLDSPSNRI